MIELRFPEPCPPLNMNDRHHWRVQHRRVRDWRDTATHAAWTIPQPRRQPRCAVEIELPVIGNRRRDPHNYTPTLKAVIDGLVVAGVWPDDTPEFVTTREPVLRVDPAGSRGDVIVRLIPTPV